MNALDVIAQRIFETAIASHRCGELLECLFDGGTATVDSSGKLVLVSADNLLQMLGKS